MIKIVLGDDHLVVRQGMHLLLNTVPDFEVVGEAADGHELVELVEKFAPQVVITDISMPSLNGMEATRIIRKRFPATQVIILSMYSASSYVIGSLRYGALGYLLKNDDYQEVVAAVYAVVAGKRYLSPQVSEKVMDALLTGIEDHAQSLAHLTDREREVLQLIAEGHTSAQIGEKLGISTRTAEKHRANLRSKLDISSQADLMLFAIEQGLVSVRE